MDIGNKIKELRILYSLTQQELADRLELSKGFISQLERNLTSPSVGTLLDIIQCLGTTPAEFFADDEPAQLVFKNEDYFEKEECGTQELNRMDGSRCPERYDGTGTADAEARRHIRHLSST